MPFPTNILKPKIEQNNFPVDVMTTELLLISTKGITNFDDIYKGNDSHTTVYFFERVFLVLEHKQI